MNTLRTAAILLAGVLMLTSSFESGAQRPRRFFHYGVHETDSLRWRDNCILADSASHTYYFVGPAGRSIMSYKSTDLKHWEGPSIIYTAHDDVWGDIKINSIWAPELHSYNGKYYIFCTFDTSEKLSEQWRNWHSAGRVVRGSQILWSDSPQGPFHTFAPHATMPSDMMTIDGTLWVEDGVPYMVYVHEWVQVTDGAIGCVRLKEDLTHWAYLQDANIGYKPDKEPTYWAPSIVDDGTEYHMFLTYVPGVFTDWNHPRRIVHLVSDDLKDWKFRSEMKLMSDRVIDADVMRMPDGTWRMWYNQEPGGKLIAYADSPDLNEWTDHGLIPGIGHCEGPKAFEWKGSYWLICDEWKGFAVYRSDDAQTIIELGR